MKENRYKRIILLIFISASFFFSTHPLADQIADTKNKLNNINNSINENKKAQSQISSQKNNIAIELKDLDMKLNITTNQLNNAQTKLNDLASKLNKAQEDLNKAKAIERKQKDIFKKRVRAMYINGGNIGYLDILLKSESFDDFISRVDAVKRIVTYDVNLFNKFQKQTKIVQDKEKHFAILKRNAEDYKNQVAQRKREIEVAVVSRQGIMRNLERQEEQYKQQEEELLKQSKQLESVIDSLQSNSSLVFSGGKLGWPVPSSSTITSPFGTRYHPILHTYKTHTGIDIAASYGAPVVAAGDGKVIFAGYYGGYGNAVIIDHGSSISTLYGHNSQLLVKVGDIVKRGQQIARAGSTGLSTGTHCHFEVRKNGAPINPMDWFK